MFAGLEGGEHPRHGIGPVAHVVETLGPVHWTAGSWLGKSSADGGELPFAQRLLLQPLVNSWEGGQGRRGQVGRRRARGDSRGARGEC